MSRKYIIEFSRAPGDVLMLTALVRDLKLTYGSDVLVDVRTPFPGLWRHNPHLTSLSRQTEGVVTLNMTSGARAADKVAIGHSKGGNLKHYATAFHRAFTERTKLLVEPLFPHGDLHLSTEEKERPIIGGPYWLITPGGKLDMVTKWWPIEYWQEAVDKLRAWGLRFVQDGANKPGHVHPPLEGVLNITGQTSIRDLIVNVFHATGVICNITLQMHIAGALHKPCVAIMGGREEPSFEWYTDAYKAFGPKAAPVQVPHRMLHTIGLLDCCRTGGCWLRRVEKLNDGKEKYNRSLCKRPVAGPGQAKVPECMRMITVPHLVNAVLSYYEDGTLTAELRHAA